MADLKSLNATGLPEAFDLVQHGEKPIITLSFESRTIRLSYIFPGFSLADHSDKANVGDRQGKIAFQHEVGIAGTGFLSESGKPLLPSFGRLLQIPPGQDYKVNTKTTGLQKFDNVKIKPAQENAQDQNAWTLEFDESIYNEDKFYPDTIVDVSKPFYMDGYRVVCIHVRPMQYNPVRESLHCFSNIEVVIEFTVKSTKDDKEVALEAYLDRSWNLEGFGNLLFNPERKYFEKNALFSTPIVMPAGRPRIPEFLIICGEAFEGPARKLQAWKKKRGLETAVVPISEIIAPGCASLSRETQVEKIKNYIREQRKVPLSPLRYVLLFGDISTIPTEERQRPGTAKAPQFDTTDYYYFTHRDAEGEECLLPWIAGGRIAALTEEEGLSVVDQIIHYEKNPPDDPEYYSRMTVAAYFEDRDRQGRQDRRANKAYLKTMETIRDHMASHGFEVNRVYVSNSRTPEQYCDGTPVPPEIKEELIYKADGPIATKKLIGLINEGQLIIGHRGHGDHLGWQNPPLTTEDLDRVDSSRPSVFFSINCRTGSFDGGRKCFAEKILALNGGAPSLIASTELSGAWRNDSMIKALFDAIWPGVIPTYPITTMRFPIKYYRIGDIMNYAKAYLLVSHGVNANTQKHFEIYHVVGDPTLHIWGSEPMTLRLRTRIKKDILVVTMNTCPKDGVLSLWYKDECCLQMEPSGTRLAIPMMLFDKLPDDAQDPARDRAYQLSIYFSAPGHRLAESHLWF